MTLKTREFDAARYIETPEDAAIFLDEAFKTGDAAFIAHALGTVARAQGVSDIAREAGVTREALYKGLSERGDPRLSTLVGVLKAMGLEVSITTPKAA